MVLNMEFNLKVNKMVYLNGQKVDNKIIDPAKHKFIGLFRPTSFPVSDGSWDVYMCRCGMALWAVQQCHEHWMLGHMDIPQYINI